MSDHIILPHYIESHISKSYDVSIIKKMKEEWNKKYLYYLELIDRNSLKFTDYFEVENENGVLLFTYSGSMILIGPLSKNGRWLEYTGIENRKFLPKNLSEINITLLNDIYVNKSVFFDAKIIKNTSPIYKIAIF